MARLPRRAKLFIFLFLILFFLVTKLAPSRLFRYINNTLVSTTVAKTTLHNGKSNKESSDVILSAKKKEWNEWFDVLERHDNGLKSKNTTSASQHYYNKYLIMYFHVMKTAGTSLSQVFLNLNKKNGFEQYMNGTKGFYHAIENPSMYQYVTYWRKSNITAATNVSIPQKLLITSFREPIERVISHYFQVKPCPDGTGGGAKCRNEGKRGIRTFLKDCPFGYNWQTQYLHFNHSNINEFDFIVRNDRMEESMTLLSISKRIPIMDLIPGNYKVRATTSSIIQGPARKIKRKQRDFHCTDQWLKKLVPKEKIVKFGNCTSGCAGKLGRHAFNDQQFAEIKKQNQQDIILWKKYVKPFYNNYKARVLKEFEVNQNDLDNVVAMFRSVKERLQQDDY